ncbi:MAG: T9SS type A sorting domain-containing protein [Bacteroidia bacterium]|nr:T9SS type A sorting domain-containing protein [Bacteroidia bacterium]
MRRIIFTITSLLLANFSFAQYQQFSVFPNTDPIQCIAAQGGLIVAGTQNGVLISIDGGATWANNSVGLPDFDITALTISNSNIISGSRTGTIAYKALTDTSWTVAENTQFDRVSSFFKNGAAIWAKHCCGSCNTYKSLDNGVSWNLISFPWGCYENFIWSNNYLFHGDWYGPQVSANNGSTWNPANNGYNTTSDFSLMGADEVGNIVVSRGGAATTGNTLYYATASTNPTWQYANGFLNHMAAIRAFAGFSNFIFAGVNDTVTFLNNGVQFTTDGGANWSLDNAIMGGVNCLTIDSAYMYAGCEDGKIWKRTLWSPTAINESSGNSLTPHIYPNPAKESVTIDNLPCGSTVGITDITGKKVYSFVIKNEQTTISTTGFVNGVYIIQVESNGAVAHKKLVVNK